MLAWSGTAQRQLFPLARFSALRAERRGQNCRVGRCASAANFRPIRAVFSAFWAANSSPQCDASSALVVERRGHKSAVNSALGEDGA